MFLFYFLLFLVASIKDIECLSVTDGNIASASLDGMVYIWDSEKRECTMAIDRR